MVTRGLPFTYITFKSYKTLTNKENINSIKNNLAIIHIFFKKKYLALTVEKIN